MTSESEAITLTRTAMQSSLAVLASIAWFAIGLPSWSTYHTGEAFESLISFTIVACIALTFLARRERPSRFFVVVLSFLVFILSSHLYNAFRGLYFPESSVIRDGPRLFLDIIELHFGGLLILGAVAVPRTWAAKWSERAVLLGSVFLGVLGFSSLSFLRFLIQDFSMQMLFLPATTLGGATFIILMACAVMAVRRGRRPFDYHPVGMSVGCVLLAASTLPLVISLATTSLIWTLSMTLQSVAFLAFFLAIAVPYLKTVGVQTYQSTISSSLIAVVFVAPFLVTLAVEAIAPGYSAVDVDAYVVTHVGAASLSWLMALLTYTHSKTKKISYLYPMILLYTAWGVTETTQVLLMFVPGQYSGESLVPYMMGGIVSLLSLVFVIKWSDSDSAWASKTNPRYWPLIGVLSQVFLLIVGLRIEALLGHGMPFLTNSPLGRSGLLVVNLFVMFEFAYVFAYMMKRDGTAFTSEIVMVGFFALWVVPGLLKSNYPDWSAGWWTSEVLLLLALMLGPVILGVMYLKELNRAESEHRRARVFSDLLVHDVSNYHQAILLSLDLLKVGLRDELRRKVVHEARGELNRADHLIRNVRQLALSQALGRASIGPVDLVECVQSAFESACPPPEQGGVHFSTSHEPGQVYVLANALLEGIFVNLFRNSLRYSRTEKHIDVSIEEMTIDGDEYAEVHVEDRGYGIPPDRKKKLFGRFMAGAEGMGLGLSVVKTLTESFGGQVKVEDRIEGDHTQGTRFTIRLPMAEKPLELVQEAT